MSGTGGDSSSNSNDSSAERSAVVFRLEKPGASSVSVSGSWCAWVSEPTTRDWREREGWGGSPGERVHAHSSSREREMVTSAVTYKLLFLSATCICVTSSQFLFNITTDSKEGGATSCVSRHACCSWAAVPAAPACRLSPPRSHAYIKISTLIFSRFLRSLCQGRRACTHILLCIEYR